ncbi:MAG: hypothetical protein M9951_17295 [Burkholderiaceae bacterium]|nr:hypothetical protein [Burkholderiaceae bacterium]
MTTILQSSTDATPDFRTGWTRTALRARARAAGLSLAISAAVVGTVATAIALFLHTMPFFWASGGISLIAIVAMVDIVLGPLLVFLVYDQRKKSLRRDLAVIICIQLAAIAYGIHASVLARPVLMTFVVDRFELVSAAEVDAEELAKAPEQFRKLSWTGPVLAAARMPDNKEEREQIMFASTSYGIDLRHLLRHYVDYGTQRDEVIARARPLTDLDRHNDPAKVAAALASIRAASDHPDRLRYLPVQGPKEDLVAVIDSDDATVLGTLRLKPWD